MGSGAEPERRERGAEAGVRGGEEGPLPAPSSHPPPPDCADLALDSRSSELPPPPFDVPPALWGACPQASGRRSGHRCEAGAQV